MNLGAQNEFPVTPQKTDDANVLGAKKEEAILRGEMKFTFFAEESAQSGPQKPSFVVEADTSLLNNDVVLLENATATIYGPKGDETHLYAPRCRLVDQSRAGKGATPENDERADRVYLEGGVRLETKTMVIEVEDLEWDNKNRMAWSDKPVNIQGDQLQLRASGMKLYPDKDSLVLNNTEAVYRITKGEKP